MNKYVISLLLLSVLFTGCMIEPPHIPPTDWDDVELSCPIGAYCHLENTNQSTIYFNFTSVPNGTTFNYQVN